MQKFRDYIYCDISKMNSYISQIPELSKIETSGSYEKTTSVDGEGKLVVAKFGTTLNEKNSKNYTLNINPMENFVNWVYDEKNAINYEGENLEKDDRDKLIVLSGK